MPDNPTNNEEEVKVELPEANGKCKVPMQGNPTVLVHQECDINSKPIGSLSAGAIVSVFNVGNGWYQIISIETDKSSDQKAGKDDDEDEDTNNEEENDDGENDDDDTTDEDENTDEDDDEDNEDKEKQNPAIGGYVQAINELTGVVQLQICKDPFGDEQKAETEVKVDENGDPIPIEEEEGEEDDEDDDNENSDDEEPFYLDDNFYKSYKIKDDSRHGYAYNIDSYQLKVCDIRGILGCPHQFLPTADTRIDVYRNLDQVGSNDSIGRVYADKIIKQMPLLLITPGVPSFMSQYSDDQKKLAITKLLGGTEDFDLTELLTGGKGRYYSLRFSYTEYFHYVNAMLRSAAVFLGITDYTVDGRKLGSFNWLYYSTNPGAVATEYSENDETDTEQRDIFGHEGLHRFLGSHAGAIAIYADCGNSTDDSFSNTTTQSQLSSALNSLSDTGREMNFLIGNVGSTLGLTLTKLTGMEDLQNNQAALTEIIDHALGGNNVLSNILNKCQTILAGGRMMFPEIWADSSFSRSYSCKMKLVSPAGDKFSLFLNILVPIYHILALTLPRQSIGQSYFSPFLVRAYSQGLFNIDMGIITDLSITKGTEGEWTIHGMPTVAEMSFAIKDMYDGMFMSTAQGLQDLNIMNNIAELDYIANSCGINIHDQEIARTIDLYKSLNFFGRYKDKVELDTIGSMQQWLNNRLDNIFGYHG